MGRGSPIREKLVAQVVAVLEICRKTGSPIPTVHTLAIQNSVAYQTMWRAVDQCRRMGILTVAPRRGIRVTDTVLSSSLLEMSMSGTTKVSPTPKKWLLVRDLLRRELIQGGLAKTPKLPSMKILGQHFGTCYPVIRKALQSLVLEGMIELCKGGYRMTRTNQRGAEDSIVLVSDMMRPNPHYGRVFTRNLDMLRALESSCYASNIRMRLIEQTSGYRQLRTSSNLKHTRGFIVWTQEMNPTETAEIVSDLALSGLPVAALDENGTLVLRGTESPDSVIQQFWLGVNADSGRIVGTFLKNLGHRRVAYFSALRNNSRLEGLREALTRTDGEEPVRGYQSNKIIMWKLHDVPGMFAENGPSGMPVHLWELARTELEPHATAALQGAAHSFALEEAFGQALSDPTITAWVGANDHVAIQCLRYLRRHDIHVPRQLAVVGFDDTTEATLHGLTSYNFNVQGLAHAIVQHLLHPRLRRERHGIPKIWEILGYVNARASTDHVRT